MALHFIDLRGIWDLDEKDSKKKNSMVGDVAVAVVVVVAVEAVVEAVEGDNAGSVVVDYVIVVDADAAVVVFAVVDNFLRWRC